MYVEYTEFTGMEPVDFKITVDEVVWTQ